MADNRDHSANSEDQTRPSGDWDKQYIAPPDANMGQQDSTGQGHTSGASASSHEYGGSATDSRVSDSRSNAIHQRDSGAEAGAMGSAYDTERQAQGGTPGSGANVPTSSDVAGLNSSTGGATNSSNASDNSLGGMLSNNELGGVMQSDSMLGPQQNRGESSGSNATSGTKPGQTRQGDDRDSMIGDHADSAGRHDNPYDSVRPTDENETPQTMGGLSTESMDANPSEGKSHLYTPGSTEEDFPAT